MVAFLTVEGLKDVLKAKEPKILTEEEEKKPELKAKHIEEEMARGDRDEKALNLIFLGVGDKVLRKIESCTTSASTIEILDKLYLLTTLPNRIFSQLEVYSFKMHDSKSIDQNVDDFLKLVGDLRHLQIEIEKETQAILLLKSLPDEYEHLRENLTNSKDKLTVEDVIMAAKSKEVKLKREGRSNIDNGEGLYTRGRTESRKGNNGSKGKSKSRSMSNKKKGEC